MSGKSSMRTPIARVRYLGSAHAGTDHFWKQRVTSVALIPLTVILVIVVTSLLGRGQDGAGEADCSAGALSSEVLDGLDCPSLCLTVADEIRDQGSVREAQGDQRFVG